MIEQPFSTTQSHMYWIKRHREYKGHWKAVGFLTGSDATNRAFYACRFRALEQVVLRCGIDLTGKRVLDVGCGLGDFARYYNACGAQVFGIDISPDAVACCNALNIGTFVQSEASKAAAQFHFPFDLIHCFDVLYHLTDDTEWEATLGAFAELSHSKTVWLLTEFRVRTSMLSALHVVKRSISRYEAQLALYDRRIVEEVPIYWLYVACPQVGQRFPRLIIWCESLGRFVAPHLNEHVVLWAIVEEGRRPRRGQVLLPR